MKITVRARITLLLSLTQCHGLKVHITWYCCIFKLSFEKGVTVTGIFGERSPRAFTVGLNVARENLVFLRRPPPSLYPDLLATRRSSHFSPTVLCIYDFSH